MTPLIYNCNSLLNILEKFLGQMFTPQSFLLKYLQQFHKPFF